MLCIYFQADFATSAVDFLHRVGRTARAGQFGLVTSMYTESNKELVSAVHRAGEFGQPVVKFETEMSTYGSYLWTNTLRWKQYFLFLLNAKL